MKRLLWFLACAIAGSLPGGSVRAQPAISACPAQAAFAATPAPATGTVDLREALEAAWQRAVAARQSDGRRSLAEAERAAAGSLWAAPPSLELSHRSGRTQGNTGQRETEIGLSVPLWLPGQRSARAGSAETASALAMAAQQVARLQLAGELREVAWQLAALQAESTQADLQAQALKHLAMDVERRVSAGDLARADALAAHAEYLAATALQSDVRQRLHVAYARWVLLTGVNAGPTATLPSTTAEATGSAINHPELQLASASTELARQRVELVRRSRSDAPELTFGVRQDTPGPAQASQGSLVVTVRLPFGTDSRNQPLEVAALTELAVAETHAQRLHERLDSDLAAARSAMRAAESQLDAETARARLLRERATLIDKSFRSGETPLPDLLRALAAAAHADSAVARQTASLGLAHARLQQVLGVLP